MRSWGKTMIGLRGTFALAAALTLVGGTPASADPAAPFVGPLHTVTTIASTVPANGDVNPYGVAVVPEDNGRLIEGDVLVSNFNAVSNLQGTGTTIVQISPAGRVSVFARLDASHLPGACPGGIGLTTALAVLGGGWVVVGSLPTTDGSPNTIGAGCLLVLDSRGNVRETLAGHGINGPWDLTAANHGDDAQLFVANVLNGTVAAKGAVVNRGTVLRIDLEIAGRSVPRVESITTIASGLAERTDPAALVVGPTGVGLGRHDTLYVADSGRNRIVAIPDASDRSSSAGAGRVVSTAGALTTPLGLAIAPGGDVLTVNAGDGNLVEITPAGTQAAVRALDTSGGPPPGAGALFGLAIAPHHAVYFVDDATNELDLLHR